MKKIIAAALFFASLVGSAPAIAGSGCQYIVTGAVLTAAQWNACFISKQNELGYTPVNKAGDSMTGLLTTIAPTTTTAGFRLNPGTAPTVPTNGDIWTTSAGLYVQVNGSTIGPLTGGAAGSFAGTSPITVSFPAGVVTYAFNFSVANVFTAQQTINLNGTATPTAITGAGFVVNPANATVGRVQVNAYGAIASFTGAIYAGTAAAPTQVLSGTQLTGINAYAYTGSAVVGPIASFRTYAAESITATAWGTKACIATTPSTTATLTDGLCQQNSGGVTIGSPTGGDKGVGTLNSASTIYINGTAVTAAGITALTGDVTATGPGSVAATLATAQPAVHTWALAQTFTVAPVFTDASGSRTALGLGTAATQNTGTSGATIPLLNGANTFSGNTVISGATFGLSGNISAGGIFGTAGIRYVNVPGTLNDTTSSGTIATAYVNVYGGNTLTSTSVTTITQLSNTNFTTPTCSGNLTCTNRSAITADSISINGQAQSTFALAVNGTSNLNGATTIGGTITYGAGPAIMSSPAAASHQFGAADAATAVAQIIRAQSVVAGTAATSGANLTIIGSLPTGTGTSGDVIIQTGVKTGSGTTQGTATSMLTVKGETGHLYFPNNSNIGDNNTNNPKQVYVGNAGTVDGFLSVGGSSQVTTQIVVGQTIRFGIGTPASTLDGRTDGTLLLENNALTNSVKISFPTAHATPTFQLGALDAAVAVAQIIRVQSVVAGTAAASGANWTFIGSLPTGTGTSGDIIFQTGVKTGSGTTQGTATTALTIKGETQGVTFASATILMPALANVSTTSAVCFNTGTGLLTYNSTVGTCTVSTIAAKNLKAPLSPKEGFDLVMAMEPWRYDLKKDRPTYKPGEQIGFVAEYAVKIDARVVAMNPDGSVAGFLYEQYTAALTAAFKYMKAENDNIRAANDNLRAEVEALKAAR